METKINQPVAKTAKATQFANGNPVNAESVKEQAAQQKSVDKKPEPQPKKEEEAKKMEEPKKEEKAFFGLNLESTLKLVEELHRRKIQRDRLLDTINTLETFEVAQQEDAEETDSNHFQGCVLTIEDDERRKFSTKNPVIIQAVAQFVQHMCITRLAEIEAGITIPQTGK